MSTPFAHHSPIYDFKATIIKIGECFFPKMGFCSIEIHSQMGGIHQMSPFFSKSVFFFQDNLIIYRKVGVSLDNTVFLIRLFVQRKTIAKQS